MLPLVLNLFCMSDVIRENAFNGCGAAAGLAKTGLERCAVNFERVLGLFVNKEKLRRLILAAWLRGRLRAMA